MGSATMPDGSVLVTGAFSGTMDADPGAGQQLLQAAGITNDAFVARLSAQGALQWAFSFGSGDDDAGLAVCTDALGNGYVTGYLHGETDLDPGPNETTLAPLGAGVCVFVAKYAPGGALIWAEAIGGLYGDQGNAIACDAMGHVRLTGSFSGVVDFDPGVDEHELQSTPGDKDIFVLELNADGTYSRAFAIGSAANWDEGLGIAIDAAGNTCLTGYFMATVDFDAGTGVAPLVSVTSVTTDAFVAKYDPDGALLWARSLGGALGDAGRSIATDAAGNTFTTGYFLGTVDADPGTDVQLITASGEADAFLWELGPDGDFMRVRTLGGPGTDRGWCVVRDAAGRTCVTGSFEYSAVVSECQETLGSPGGPQAFLLVLDQDWNCLWHEALGGEFGDAAFTMTTGSDGDWTVGGQFALACDMDPGAGATFLTAVGGGDAFVQRIDPATVGLSPEPAIGEAHVSPNPSTGAITLAMPGAERAVVASMIDAAGRRFVQFDLRGANGTIDPHVGPGSYFLEITGATGARCVVPIMRE